MATFNSNPIKTKTKRVSPDINTEYVQDHDHSRGHNNEDDDFDLKVSETFQTGEDGDSDGDGDGDHIEVTNLGSHNPNSWEAYIKKEKRLKSELRVHLSNGKGAEVDRVQRELDEHNLLGEVEPDELDPITIATLDAINGPEIRRRRRVLQPPPPPPPPSNLLFYGHLFHTNNAVGGQYTSRPAHPAPTHQASSANQHGPTASVVAVQLPASVLAAAQVSPPTTLNLSVSHLPINFPDNLSLGSAGKALNGNNRVMYRTAPPPNLNYNLITFEMTILEMATYIPLAYLWSGFLERFEGSAFHAVIAEMMLWARSLDRNPDLIKKRESLRSTMKHKNIGPASADKTASSWTHGNNIFSKASPTLIADVPLLRLRHGVARIPQGQHRGRLTIAIEHAFLNGHWRVMLSEVEEYIRQCKLAVPAPLVAGADAAAVRDFKAMYAAAPH